MQPGACAVRAVLNARATAADVALHSLDISFAYAALQLEGDQIQQTLDFLAAVAPLLKSRPAPPRLHALTTSAALNALATAGAWSNPPRRPQVSVARVTTAPLRLVFSFAAPTDGAFHRKRYDTTFSKLPAMLLSAAGVSCATFTVREFEIGVHAQSVAEVAAQYTGLVKEAVFSVCDLLATCAYRSQETAPAYTQLCAFVA
jgi:hypothetical protein